MRTCSATLVALLTIGCAYHSPDAPSAVTPISTTAPFSLSLGATVGMGADAGHATVTAKVQNVNGVVLSGVTVQFTTDVGTLSAASVVTGVDGTATTTITSASTAALTATAGTLTTKMLVVSQPVATPPPAPPAPIPAPPPPSPGPLSVTLSAAGVTIGTQTIVSALVRNGPPQSLAWSFGDGATFAGISTTTAHTYGAVGSYVVGVTVTDTSGRTASGSATVTVNPVPPPPPPPPPPGPSYTVTLAASPATVVAGNSSTLTATVALANGATTAPTSYAWDCTNDGTIDATTTTSTYGLCTYATAGTVTSRVTVSDGTVTGSGTTTVTVTAAPAPSYTVTLSATPTSITVGGSSNLVASVTQVSGAPPPTAFAWDCTNDGVIDDTTTINTKSCTYATPGTATAKVTVTGGTVTASATTTVTVALPPPPTVTISCSTGARVTVAPGTASTCVASATVSGAVVPATSITKVDWTFGDGATAPATAGNVSPAHQYLTANTFTVVGVATIAGVAGTVTGSTTTTVLP